MTGQQAPPGPGPPSGQARPVRQALAAAGYVTLEQLTQVTEADLARMHGIGPKAIAQVRDALAAAVRITPARSAGDSLPGEAVAPAPCDPHVPVLLAVELGNGTR